MRYYFLALFFTTTLSLYSQTEKKITIKLLKTPQGVHQFENPADSIYIRFYSNNISGEEVTSNRYMLRDKVPDATYELFINSKLRLFASTKNNKLDGTNISYHENGRVSSVYPHKNGERHGLWQKFFEDGTPDFEDMYSEGKSISGISYRNGKVEKKYYYENDKLKKTETFNDLGEVIATDVYK